MKQILSIFYRLGKVKITSFVALSSVLGYILASGKVDFFMLIPMMGVFILACGTSALNQVQEWRYDALMNRTKGRPIPKSQLTPEESAIISILAIISGEIIIYVSSGTTATILGAFAVVWYNAFYTPLKRVTPMAVVPGALIGSIPPAIGWVAGGGVLLSPQILSLCTFLFIWQIPHFWLLVLIYNKDYERAGFPTLTQKFTKKQLSRITYIWILALAASCMLVPLFGLSKNLYSVPVLVAASFFLLWRTKTLLKQADSSIIRLAFVNINIYVLFVTSVLSLDKLIFG
ncbi:MAG: Protoheme farnesyltransferase [Ignavibacteria bacterium]|nr:Protoheme farnesyltransferase [Ignavibacteria bacterium]